MGKISESNNEDHKPTYLVDLNNLFFEGICELESSIREINLKIDEIYRFDPEPDLNSNDMGVNKNYVDETPVEKPSFYDSYKKHNERLMMCVNDVSHIKNKLKQLI